MEALHFFPFFKMALFLLDIRARVLYTYTIVKFIYLLIKGGQYALFGIFKLKARKM